MWTNVVTGHVWKLYDTGFIRDQRGATLPLCSVCSKFRRCAHWQPSDGAALFCLLTEKNLTTKLKLHHWIKNSISVNKWKTSLNYYKLQILNSDFSWQPNRPCWLQSKIHIQFIFYFIILLIKLSYSIHPFHESFHIHPFHASFHIHQFHQGYLCHLLLPIFVKVDFKLFWKLKQRQEIDWVFKITWDWLWCKQNQEFQSRFNLSHHINY